jgi:hypothetical protein
MRPSSDSGYETGFFLSQCRRDGKPRLSAPSMLPDLPAGAHQPGCAVFPSSSKKIIDPWNAAHQVLTRAPVDCEPRSGDATAVRLQISTPPSQSGPKARHTHGGLCRHRRQQQGIEKAKATGVAGDMRGRKLKPVLVDRDDDARRSSAV